MAKSLAKINKSNPVMVIAAAEHSLLSRLRKFVLTTGYPITDYKFLRKLGPPIDTEVIPARGAEIFTSWLPPDVFEDDLYWFFSEAGVIYDIRLMVRPSGLANRGYAFVRYCNPEDAQKAILSLDRKEIRPRHRINVCKSAENNRLFISGLPVDKSKLEIWNELVHRGVRCISDVIVYNSCYNDRKNRGFVFVEFNTHEDAASTRRRYVKGKPLLLWQVPVLVDWSKPLLEVDPTVMASVKRLFIRNISSEVTKRDLALMLVSLLGSGESVEKLYKRRTYCFIHFYTREVAEEALNKLKLYFSGTDVEVTWSIPPWEAKRRAKFLPPRFRRNQSVHSTKYFHRNSSSGESSSSVGNQLPRAENPCELLQPLQVAEQTSSDTVFHCEVQPFQVFEQTSSETTTFHCEECEKEMQALVEDQTALVEPLAENIVSSMETRNQYRRDLEVSSLWMQDIKHCKFDTDTYDGMNNNKGELVFHNTDEQRNRDWFNNLEAQSEMLEQAFKAWSTNDGKNEEIAGVRAPEDVISDHDLHLHLIGKYLEEALE